MKTPGFLGNKQKAALAAPEEDLSEVRVVYYDLLHLYLKCDELSPCPMVNNHSLTSWAGEGDVVFF